MSTTAAWTRYWASGALHSCPGTFGSDYGAAIGSFWRDIFGALSPDQAVLDVATGNGAVVKLIVDHFGEAAPEIWGVDCSEIKPSWTDQLPADVRRRLHFMSRTDVENLPFGDQSFDLVTSQFGLEYADIYRAGEEVARALRPGGRLAAVMHHERSQVAVVARQDLPLYEGSLAAGGPADLAEQLIPYMALSAMARGRERLGRDPSAADARARYNAAMRNLRNSSPPSIDLAEAISRSLNGVLAVAQTNGTEPARLRLQTLREELHAASVRAKDLLAHALSDEAFAQWRAFIEERANLSCETSLLHAEGLLIGRAIIARRA